MSVIEVKEFDKAAESKGCKESDEVHRIWWLSVNGINLFLKRYGSFCQWNRLVLEKDSKEVYRIELERLWENGNDVGVRRELFFGELYRKYRGNQFSFIEYLGLICERGYFPSDIELIDRGLERVLFSMYQEKAKKILELDD